MVSQTRRCPRLPAAVGSRVVVLALAAAACRSLEAQEKLSHARWDRILKACVTEAGWVDYPRIRKEFAGELKAYLEELGRVELASLGDQNARKAFWINAYNAVCVQAILDQNLPAEVPRAKVFGANIFTEAKHKVAGKTRSLDDIEHGILRREFKDNRIHAAIVCAASSCPRLRAEVYDPARLDEQLDDQCRSWINVQKNKKDERKNYLDQEKKVMYVSKIFDWFGEDFGGDEAGVLAFVKRFADEPTRAFLEKNKVRVRYLTYDWSLNKQG
jgi:hypothetical protein